MPIYVQEKEGEKIKKLKLGEEIPKFHAFAARLDDALMNEATKHFRKVTMELMKEKNSSNS